MKILLGLLLSFNAFAADYKCTKDIGFLGLDYIGSLVSGESVDAPYSFDYPQPWNDPRLHFEQSTIQGPHGNPEYAPSKGYIVSDVTNVANMNDITLKLTSIDDTKSTDLYLCERTPVPYQKCFLKSVIGDGPFPSPVGSSGAFTIPGSAGHQLLVLTPTNLEHKVGFPPKNTGSNLYNVDGVPSRVFEDIRFLRDSSPSQKYYCKGSLPAISGEFSQEFRHNMPQIIDDTQGSPSSGAIGQ